MGSLLVLFTGVARATPCPGWPPKSGTSFDLLPAAELSLDQMDARPGNVLVPVRNPHSLAHVAAALQTPRDRDVVVMTVRLLGVDVSADGLSDAAPTPAERRVLSEVSALAERHDRPVRLLVVPAHDVFDAIVATILRLRSSDVYVGESSTLSADEQARLLGEAWEKAAQAEPLDVRLVVHHRSGRTDTYHLGAHPPSLSPGDLDLIHRVWLDATKAIGPHVHHHDVVRAALTQMEQQLNGPQRDEALAAIRQTARPADELAAVLRARDYARLRDMMRNRHAERRRDAPDRAQPRGSGRRVPRAAAQGRRGGLRVPVAGRQGSAAQGDGAGRRRGAAQQHGARRPHDVPRRTAGDGDAPAADAADAGGARRRDDAARLSGALGRPSDDAALRGGARALDGARGARLRPHARPGQRNAERHLRRRRAGPAHRRHPHPRVPARAGRAPRRGSDGPALRRAEGHRRSGGGRRRVPPVRSHRAAGHRHRRHAHRHRHDRRRAGRGRSDGDAARFSASADRRPSTSRTWTSRSAA